MEEALEEQVVEPAEEVEPIEDATASEPEAEEIEAVEEDTPAEPPKGVQKRINELTRARHEESRAREAAERRARELEERLDSFYKKPDEVAQPKVKAPREDDFDTYEDFVRATTRYEIKLEMQEAEKKREAQQAKLKAEEKKQSFQTRVNGLLKTGTSLHEDFDEVVRSMPLTNDTLKAALETEKGADVLYYLGNNIAEAERIAGLTPYGQAIEIGKIEAKLKPKPKEPTKAPDPITPLGTAGSDISVDLSNEKLEDAKWEKEFRARRQRLKGR